MRVLVAITLALYASLVGNSEEYCVKDSKRFSTQTQRDLDAIRGAGHPAVQKAREYIEAHFAEEVSVSGLAALVSLSPYYFARAFKKEIGLPPHAYLDGIRIRKVLEFLDRGHTVVSAALSAGYVDQSHLTHRFKRILGITPGQYVRNSQTCKDS